MKKHGRYSLIQHEGLQEKLGKLEALEQDVMDLSPEVQLLRALVIDYVDRYQAFSEALIAWHADQNGKTSKPRKVMDITDAGNLIEKISRTVHRIHQIHSTGSITLDTFRRVVESMGIIVAAHVQEKQVLNSIEQEWSSLALEAKDPGLNPAPVGELADGVQESVL